MKYIIIIFSLLLPTCGWSQSYVCKPVRSCMLHETGCEQAPDEIPIFDVIFSESVVTINIGGEIQLLKVVGIANDAGRKSYFGAIDSDHVMFTLYENGSLFVLGSIEDDGISAMIAELSCDLVGG